ncbi:hypothetical protein FB451DRAFT_1162005 [Mycena latifolia]|nr:hypothetical protein FB451DRAFT_1162005 [Mycena latifolia]
MTRRVNKTPSLWPSTPALKHGREVLGIKVCNSVQDELSLTCSSTWQVTSTALMPVSPKIKIMKEKSTQQSCGWTDGPDQAAGPTGILPRGFLSEAAEIEQAAAWEEHGPLAVCTAITNHSNQKCHIKYRIWYPVEEDRSKCPYVLITSCGAQSHPIPLPEKTPKGVHEQILSLLHNLQEDIPDMTARRLRHSATKSYRVFSMF